MSRNAHPRPPGGTPSEKGTRTDGDASRGEGPSESGLPGTRRRATTPPPEGSDPHPEGEPRRHAPDANDERMRRERPPHY